MQFQFSATVDKVNCHIRAYGATIAPKEVVDQRPHKHYFMEFHCVFEGEETLFFPVEDRQICLRPGQIILIPQNVYHGATTNHDTVERMCFNFSADSEEAKNSPMVELYKTIREPAVFENAEINAFLQQCRRQWKRESGLFAVQQQGLRLLNVVLQLMEQVAGTQAPHISENAHALRQKWIIEDYIEQRFTDSAGLEGLAQELFLSQRQTRKLVQQFMGEDFKTLMIRRRMELAEIYLKNPEKSLQLLSDVTGDVLSAAEALVPSVTVTMNFTAVDNNLRIIGKVTEFIISVIRCNYRICIFTCRIYSSKP